MSTQPNGAEPLIDVVLCIDRDAFSRLRSVIRHLGVGLIDQNARARMVTLSAKAIAPDSLGPIEVMHHDERSWPLRGRSFRRLVDTLSARTPSLICCISSGSFNVAWKLAETFDVDVVPHLTATRDVAALERFPTERRSYVIAASQTLLDMTVRRAGVPADRISLVRPGVLRGTEVTCFTEENATPSLVCTGKLTESSGADAVIEACAMLRDRGHRVLTFLLGEGSHESALRRLVRARKLEASVTFVRPTGDIADVLRGADVYIVLPGDNDVSARPLEAMANGTVVVGFDGSIADCLRDGETAIVCHEHTAEALATAIERLLKDHTFARTLAAGARDYVKEKHQMSTMAELTLQVFRQATAKGRTYRINAAT